MHRRLISTQNLMSVLAILASRPAARGVDKLLFLIFLLEESSLIGPGVRVIGGLLDLAEVCEPLARTLLGLLGDVGVVDRGFQAGGDAAGVLGVYTEVWVSKRLGRERGLEDVLLLDILIAQISKVGGFFGLGG